MIDENIRIFLKEWLVGMVIASFSFSAGFIVRLERGQHNSKKPDVLYLEIKSRAVLGNPEKWSDLVKSLPLKARRGEPEEPATAYMLMLLIGGEIISVDIAGDGGLSIDTNDGDTLRISGVDDVWDESWIISDKTELNAESEKEVVCDSIGNVSFL